MENDSGHPLPPMASASVYGNFAFLTIRDRLPVILTKVVDGLVREKENIVATHGKESREELKQVIGCLSKLKNEIQTDKAIVPITDTREDVVIWNQYIENEEKKTDCAPSWFKSAFLEVECYMYRRIQEAFELSTLLKGYDPFEIQKQEAFLGSMNAIQIIANYLLGTCEADRENETKANFFKIVQLDLWGNKCDLSISAGKENSQKIDPLAQLDDLKDYILVKDVEAMWSVLQSDRCRKTSAVGGCCRVDFILDNAGFELFTDLCFADFLTSNNLARTVIFHVKEMPWYVSDTTARDIEWTVQTMKNLDSDVLCKLAGKWQRFFDSGQWKAQGHPYWTLPYGFSQMKQGSPDLYEDLGHSDLLIFKGDLNYRKLTGDREWDPVTPFSVSLTGFCPTNVCALRTLKAEVVVGLQPGQAESIQERQKNWRILGDYAVIQFTPKL